MVTVLEARKRLKEDYWDDVTSVAADIKSQLISQLEDGRRGNSLRCWLLDRITREVGLSSRVTNTQDVKMCLIFSNNPNAFFDSNDADSATEDDELQWVRLATAAFEFDVKESLENIEVDINEPDNGWDDPPDEDEAEEEAESCEEEEEEEHEDSYCDDCMVDAYSCELTRFGASQLCDECLAKANGTAPVDTDEIADEVIEAVLKVCS